MNATIYIHKTNQAAWDAIDNKSDFVNACLTDLKELPPTVTEDKDNAE